MRSIQGLPHSQKNIPENFPTGARPKHLQQHQHCCYSFILLFYFIYF